MHSPRCWYKGKSRGWHYKSMSQSVRFSILFSILAFSATLVVICKGWTGQDTWYAEAPGLTELGKQKRYTIVVNTFKRHDLLKRSLEHYGHCNRADAIRVQWSEADPPPADVASFLTADRGMPGSDDSVEVKFDVHLEDSLNNRFKPLPDVRTEAIFSVDDDLLVPCETLEFAFELWTSAPDQLVGFVPRMHWRKKHSTPAEYSYGGWWSVWWTGRYSMILTKAAFLHHKYFEQYTNELPREIFAYAHKARNCEDIAMSFLVANQTGAPPLWVKGAFSEIGSYGISSLGNHQQRRSECLNQFHRIYGYMPLIEGHVKAVQAVRDWFW
ncbi:Acetylglucosaminyltransferase [Klebsormidium nitens]|uniref:Acetylglucosaminyltransferase n=1 Tax=Klebsormidium nitens TaxID=105231 RepID=A0A1Y1I4C2_KLENI|nr:Acetylglucosaminyltransferase [Klebsormidium nitens]|eukprot:GAQ83597.1 Acetylglucosaminyltransferase [Klebsormidium nitens]